MDGQIARWRASERERERERERGDISLLCEDDAANF